MISIHQKLFLISIRLCDWVSKEPLVSSSSFWHWLVDICHFYSTTVSKTHCLSLLLALNLSWQLIMLQVLGSLHFILSHSYCLCVCNAIIFTTWDNQMVHYTSCPHFSKGSHIREVVCVPSVLLRWAVINVFMVWSKCRYLHQLGPSVMFFLWHPERNSRPIREAIHQSGKQRHLPLAALNTSHHIL